MAKKIPKAVINNLFGYLDSLDKCWGPQLSDSGEAYCVCQVVLASGEHVRMFLQRDGTLNEEIIGEWGGGRHRNLNAGKIEFIQVAWESKPARTFSMPWRSTPNPSNPPSGLFYHKSNIEMKLGDRIRIKRLFRRSLEGQVTFIARGEPDPISDPDQIHQWGYEYVHPGMKVTLYQPAETPPDRKFVFVSRYDS